MFDKAFDIATRAHAGQLDKGGHDYIGHPLRVADYFRDSDTRTVAILHDVVEDTEVTLGDLHELFPEYIVIAVDAITRRKREQETFFNYIYRVKENEIARRVKIADLTDNSDLGRVEHDPEMLKMVEGMVKNRYVRAFRILRNEEE